MSETELPIRQATRQTTRHGQPPSAVRTLLSDPTNEAPYHFRIQQQYYPDDELRAEILRMAVVILSQAPNSATPPSTPGRRLMQDKLAKWEDIREHPQWLDGLNTDILNILVVDAYWDLNWVCDQ
ncbi:hypothetical protein LTR56_008725 [Elasticomyces elasticus]|nr:hypothetical protein LTR22_026895 [Elasticomyces elasticus]KAK3646108.1 hypothetical protein LTR56_008725 [Elasticomyces elasticus]KAK4924289.1 hypothetical protein LTR49_008589 [Elasticomyces elasticus]KAK5759153.1 hypothetical protein LTS12_010762 [Elasticomyces elasticus]